MKKNIIFLCLCVLAASSAFAGDWYVMNAYRSKSNDCIVSLTKVDNEEKAKEVAGVKSSMDFSSDGEWISSEISIDTGKKFDEAYDKVFAQEKATAPYVYFVDNDGFQTVFKCYGMDPLKVDDMIKIILKRVKEIGTDAVIVEA
ncbi:MAG: hypothetical protein HQL29_06715 [Candidatus Omnitrophica bacterium]|nr:hypothetical protein [Candidatus Omnitrophota bacterium]